MDYSRMLLDHVVNEVKCTIACLPVPVHEATTFGVMAVNEENMVIDFVEKPPTILGDDTKVLASMGIYVFNADCLYALLEEDLQTLGSNHDFGKDILLKIVASGEGYAHSFALSCVQNDDNAPPYWRANLDLASVMPELDTYDVTWPIRTHMEPLPPAKFVQDRSGSHGMTINSLVSGGCIISGSVVVDSVLFPRVRVNSFCNIDLTVLLPDVVVSRSCCLRRCVIDRACELPEGMVIGENPDEDSRRFHHTDEGIVLVTRAMLAKLANAGQ